MGSHTDQLQAKIDATQGEIQQLRTQIGRVAGDLGAVLAQDPVDEKRADRLQAKRDEHARAQERYEIRLQALTAEKPAAERMDAAARLNEIAGEASALAAANTEARQKYEQALVELLDAIDPAYEPALRRKDLQSEAAYLSEMYTLPLPALPEVTQPEPGAAGTVYRRCVGFFELLHNRSEWGQKLTELQSQRKRAEFAERVQRERETGARISL